MKVPGAEKKWLHIRTALFFVPIIKMYVYFKNNIVVEFEFNFFLI